MRFVGLLMLLISVCAFEHAWAVGIREWRWDTFWLGVAGFVLLFPNLTFGLFGDRHGKRK
jgi:hypothetical protein